jgi:hypothetical protein
VYWNAQLETDVSKVFDGNKCLRFYSPQQSAELSNGVSSTLTGEQDSLFFRWYSKFDPSFDVTGSSHNGGGMSASYMVNGNATPGIPANGYNKFLVTFECWRGDSTEPNPGNLNVYVYHPEQRDNYGDHFFPTGVVLPWTYLPGDFGTEFVSRPNVVPELGKWYCFELFVKANTIGVRDGRIAMWVDGELIADFQSLRFRDIDTLKIDRIDLSLHIKSNTASETWKWYDNVVAAKSYIGPLSTSNATKGDVRRPPTARPNTQTGGATIYSLSGRKVARCGDGSKLKSDGTQTSTQKFGLKRGAYLYEMRLSQGATSRGRLSVVK